MGRNARLMYKNNAFNKQSRDRREIIQEVLAAIADGETGPTRIMYRCNVIHYICKNILDELNVLGFVNVAVNGVNSRRTYSLTEKGVECLRLMRRLEELFCAV